MAARRPAFDRTRGLWFAAGVVCLSLCALVESASARSSFAGSYTGVGSATGMAMALNEDGNLVYGRVTDGQGNTFEISGEISGGTVAGRLASPSTPATFQLELKSTGAQFVLIPVVAGGQPNFAAAKPYFFARGQAPSSLADFRVTPPRKGGTIEFAAFLQNYRSWTPKDVANAYTGMSDRDRALINKFDHLQADVMSRLCRGGAPTASIMSASEKEDLSCGELTSLIDEAASQGALTHFNDVAIYQMSALYAGVACNPNHAPAGRCADAAAASKHAAQSWQSAGHIFADVGGLGVRSGAVADDMLVLSTARQSTVAAVAPPKEQAPPVRIVAKAAPTPRVRPQLKSASFSAPPVDEAVLASADQSAEVARPVRKMSLKEGFGFQLRPGLGQTLESSGAAPAAETLERKAARPRPRPAVRHEPLGAGSKIRAPAAVPRSSFVDVPATRKTP